MKKETLTAVVYLDFRAGVPCETISERYNIRLFEVSKMFNEWEREKKRRQVELSKNFTPPIFPQFDRDKKQDFILCTNNNAVLDAYERMINPPKARVA